MFRCQPTLKCVGLSIVVAGAAFGVAGDRYYYFKRPIELTPVAGEYAVQATGATVIARSFGESRPHAIAGWRTVKPTPTMRESTFESKLASSPGVSMVSPVFTNPQGYRVSVTRRIFVKFAPGVSLDSARSVIAGAHVGAITNRNFAHMPGVYEVISSSHDGRTVLSLANQLAQRPDVVFAEPDMIAETRHDFIPNDTNFLNCWYLRNTGQFSGSVSGFDVRAYLAWDRTVGRSSVKVLVLDNGTQNNHPDLVVAGGATFTGEPGAGTPVNQYDNHGTPVAGCIGATLNNGLGVAGVAPGCQIYAAKWNTSTSSSGGTFQYSWFANALDWGTTNGCRVSNNSNGFGQSATIDTAYQTAKANGMVHFVSSGNSGANSIGYPASCPYVNAVGAIDFNGTLSSFSQYGTGQAFVAPGSNIYTIDRTGTDGYSSGDYGYVAGTSFSSPITAGVAALVVSANPRLTPDQVTSIMRRTARDLGAPGYDVVYGYGLPQADAAVRMAQQSKNGIVGLTLYDTSTANLTTVKFDANATQVASWNWITQMPTGFSPTSNFLPDLNGDGMPDVLIASTSGAATDYGSVILNSSGTALASINWLCQVSSGFNVEQVVDWKGTGRSDMIMSFNRTGSYTDFALFSPNATGGFTSASGSWTGSTFNPGNPWYWYGFNSSLQVVAVGSFGDAMYRLARHPYAILQASDGTLYLQDDDAQPNSFAPGVLRWLTRLPGWTVVGLGDVDGDGDDDILMRSSVGELAVIKLVQGAVQSTTWLTQYNGFSVVGFKDMNGDGRADIVLRNDSTGDLFTIFLAANGKSVQSVNYLTAYNGWAVLAVDDIDGDGTPDILIRNTSTYNVAVIKVASNGTSLKGVQWLGYWPSNWSVLGVLRGVNANL